MEEQLLNITQEVNFHGIDYVLQLKAQSDILSIQLDQMYEIGYWHNTFTAAYLEDLTQKTGNRKKFFEFVKMLAQAIKQPNNQLNVELLTYQDLEQMKQKKTSTQQPIQQSQQPTSSNLQSNNSFQSINSNSSQSQNQQASNQKINKRYMIVSCIGEQEKIHYPLSLNYDENQDIDKLRNTIKKLKMELDEAKVNIDSKSSKESLEQRSTGKGESFFLTDNLDKKQITLQNTVLEQVKSENELLKQKIKRLEDSFMQKKGAVEFDHILKNKFELENEIELLRKDSQREIDKLKTTLDNKEFELLEKKKEILELKKELTTTFEGDEAAKRLKAHIIKLSEESEQELISSRKTIQSQQKEMEKQSIELDNLRNNDKKQKNRIKQLEIELENASKRVSSKGVSDRLYSPYNKNSLSAGRRANSVPIRSYSPSNRYQYTKNSGTPNSSKNSFNSRTSSNGSSAERNKISPSYNYNFRKNQGVTSASQSSNITKKPSGGNFPVSAKAKPLTNSNTVNTRNYNQKGYTSNNRLNSNSPKTNFSPNTRQSNQYKQQQPQVVVTRLSPSGNRNNYSNNNQRYQGNQQRQQQYQKNPSPNSRLNNNYTGTNTTNTLMKKIEETKTAQIKTVPKEFQDNHLASTDLDSRLDRLQNLLNQAKK